MRYLELRVKGLPLKQGKSKPIKFSPDVKKKKNEQEDIKDDYNFDNINRDENKKEKPEEKANNKDLEPEEVVEKEEKEDSLGEEK